MNTFTDWIIAYMAVITAGLTFGLLVTAWWAASAARDTLAQMRADSEGQRQDSARATRPYVHARMVPSIAGLDTWDLIIENTGRTAAYGLHLQIDADAIPDDKVTRPVLRMASAGLTVHPGERIRTYWVIEATKKDALGFRHATVTVSYRDSEREEYEETPVLLEPDDLGLTPAPRTGAVRGGDRDDHLERNTLNTLRAIAHHLGDGNR